MTQDVQRSPGVVAAGESGQQAQTLEALRVALDVAGELTLPLDGDSMGPAWSVADGVRVVSLHGGSPRWGDVVVFERNGRWYAHRLLAQAGGRMLTKGDARWAWDRPLVPPGDLRGRAAELVVRGRLVPVNDSPVLALVHLVGALLAWPLLMVRRG